MVFVGVLPLCINGLTDLVPDSKVLRFANDAGIMTQTLTSKTVNCYTGDLIKWNIGARLLNRQLTVQSTDYIVLAEKEKKLLGNY